MNGVNNSLAKDFDMYVESVMEAYEAQGVAVSIFDRDETHYERYYGYRDTEKKLGIDENTIFGLASITKSFTCLATLQLVEDGKIDIDGLISTYIPEFTGKNQKGVRVRHLLSHTAGFYPQKRILAKDVAMEMGLYPSEDQDLVYNQALAVEGIQRVAERLDKCNEYIGQPGEFLSYSNDSFAMLSDIIRRYGGESSYAEYVNKNILKPLGMDRSSVEFDAPAKDKNVCSLYIHKGGKLESSLDFYDNAFVLMGGGSMKSTVSDLKKYVQMYLNDGKAGESKILGQHFIQEMIKPRIFYRFQQDYGYGLSIKFMDDLTVIGHGGSLTGVSSTFQWSPQIGRGVIVLCNTSEVPAASIADAAMRLASGKRPDDGEDSFADILWDKKTIDEACGVYVSGEGSVFEITLSNGNIGLKMNGEEMNVRTVGKDMLLIKKPFNNPELILMKDPSGRVWGIRTGGRIIPKAKA